MVVSREDAIELLVAMGYVMATSWPDDKIQQRLSRLDTLAGLDKITPDHPLCDLKHNSLAALVAEQGLTLGEVTDTSAVKAKGKPVPKVAGPTGPSPAADSKDSAAFTEKVVKGRGKKAAAPAAEDTSEEEAPAPAKPPRSRGKKAAAPAAEDTSEEEAPAPVPLKPQTKAQLKAEKAAEAAAAKASAKPTKSAPVRKRAAKSAAPVATEGDEAAEAPVPVAEPVKATKEKPHLAKVVKSRDKQTRGYFAGYALAHLRDELDRPSNDTIPPEAVKLVDDMYVDQGGKSNLADSRWYMTLCAHVIRGYFKKIDDDEAAKAAKASKKKT
jgi:hypothetical protein